MADLETLEARRAAALEVLQAASAKADAADQERAVMMLEVRAKYTQELGREGVDFLVFDAGVEGPIVLKLGQMVLWKEFRAKLLSDDGATLEAEQKYLLGCLAYPAREKLLEILQRRSSLHDDLVVELKKLHGANIAEQRGK